MACAKRLTWSGRQRRNHASDNLSNQNLGRSKQLNPAMAPKSNEITLVDDMNPGILNLGTTLSANHILPSRIGGWLGLVCSRERIVATPATLERHLNRSASERKPLLLSTTVHVNAATNTIVANTVVQLPAIADTYLASERPNENLGAIRSFSVLTFLVTAFAHSACCFVLTSTASPTLPKSRVPVSGSG